MILYKFTFKLIHNRGGYYFPETVTTEHFTEKQAANKIKNSDKEFYKNAKFELIEQKQIATF